MSSIVQQDLVVLVPCKDMKVAMATILARHASLRIKPLTFGVFAHNDGDSACLLTSHEFLRPLQNRFAFALVMFDREGCGAEGNSREELESQVGERLDRSGWKGRSAVVVIDPELEIWVWGESPHVAEVLGWRGRTPSLKDWLLENGHLKPLEVKPRHPKEALRGALRVQRKPPSSAIYRTLAQTVSLDRCTDPAFLKLKSVLQAWFPAGG